MKWTASKDEIYDDAESSGENVIYGDAVLDVAGLMVDDMKDCLDRFHDLYGSVKILQPKLKVP
jgi:hypothetical protein